MSPDRELVELFKEARELFIDNPRDPVLRDHALTGSMHNYRSFEAAEDLLVIYLEVKEGILFYNIGNHNQVYSK